MGEACGVSWDGTSSGKLEESSIPDPPDHKSHYLNAADTKGDSSFPVVDGENNLRSGNVSSAWDLRNQGDGVSEECLRKLDNAFDSDVLPDSAYENSDLVSLQSESTFSQHQLPTDALSDGFNRHGVRENDDGSIDVRFVVMEPGVRKGAEVTEQFLRKVASKDHSRLPLQLDHSESQRANVGYVEPDNIKFSGGVLRAQVHIPDTGSDVRQDVIADFTHDPPQITDISPGFDPRTLEVTRNKRGEDAPRFVDGRLREFSLTPFPAGYDSGGITPEFSEQITEAGGGCGCGSEAESQLKLTPHTVTTYTHD